MCILSLCISQTSNKLTSIQDDCIVCWPTFTTENQAIVRIIVYHGHGFYGTYWHLLRLQSSGEAPCLLFINFFGFLGTSYQLVRRISSNEQIGHDSTLRIVFFQRDFDVTHFHSKSEILIQSPQKDKKSLWSWNFCQNPANVSTTDFMRHYRTLLPHIEGTDGFFMARWIKKVRFAREKRWRWECSNVQDLGRRNTMCLHDSR